MDPFYLKIVFAICGTNSFVYSQDIFEGDMVFAQGNSDVISSVRNGYVHNPRYLWPDGLVFYSLSTDIRYNNGRMDNLTKAMDDIESLTCVTFHDISNMEHTPNDYVYIGFIGDRRLKKSAKGCWSSVGRQGGRQVLNLEPPQCFELGLIKHELMHVLAFVHEHNRFDRDEYVKINYENIQKEYKENFKIYNDSYDDVEKGIETSMTPYDYQSLMHYGRTHFSKKTNLDTITPLDNTIEYLGSNDLSIIDIVEVNRAYNCNISQDIQIDYTNQVVAMKDAKIKKMEVKTKKLMEDLETCQTQVVPQSEQCQQPAAIDHGEFVCIDGDTSSGAVCYLLCQDGFVGSEGEMAECVAGRWQSKGNTSLTCEPGVAMLVGGKEAGKGVELYSTGGKCSQRLKSLPNTREGHSSIWWEGEVVACGGRESEARDTCYKAFRRHGEEDWELHSRLLGRRRYQAQVSVAGKIFLMGGDSPDSRNTTEVFGDGKWSKLSSEQQFGRGSCAVKDSVESLIITGGRYSSKQVWRYNVIKNTWEKLPDMLKPRYHHACVTITDGGKKGVLVAGGDLGEEQSFGTSELFYLETNKWEMKGKINIGRTGASMVVVGGSPAQVLLMGGFTQNKMTLDSVEQYNMDTNDWTICQERMKDGRGYFSVVAAPVGRFRHCNIS